MAKTPSTMLALGTPAPDFSLPNYGADNASMPIGDNVCFADVSNGKSATLVMFICNHCPFVIHIREELASISKDYKEKDLGMVAINANDTVNYADDSPERMIAEAKSAGYQFPYLFDESQAVAKAYRAACTPDFFLFNNEQELVYRGQLDASRPGNGVPVTGADVRRAIDATLSGASVSTQQTPSIGCNIKWKPGNEPDYFSS